eukprot:gnl/TRDRNA2_/TRDRNA2_187708_c0_seq1.p1 gnl/TRDRNA2_/TRDRNA2_187708_c0~~gnl/TRDRNA2_/TRDRNA2_187708_c0_seq1.p1  ORF type:complete len:248 (+),score=37.50 gnl/TRDRNA2_/TRDRNA2_187708_c0_seq1:140-883(+)
MMSSWHTARLGAAAALAAGAALLWHRRRRRGTLAHTYTQLTLESLPDMPDKLLSQWLAEAQQQLGFVESRCMMIATSSASEGATVRTVLLREVDPRGCLLFGSAAGSLKARQLEEDPRCEAVLRFGQRQIRVRGTAEVLHQEPEVSDRLFCTLPKATQVGLALLDQGKPTSEESYAALRQTVEKGIRSCTDGTTVPSVRPSKYVAFRLRPSSFEFYSGGHPSYINDRFLYVRKEAKEDFFEVMRLQA